MKDNPYYCMPGITKSLLTRDMIEQGRHNADRSKWWIDFHWVEGKTLEEAQRLFAQYQQLKAFI